MNHNDMIKIASEAALMAGEEIMKIYNDSEFIDFKKKKDNSPLTKADRASHNIISKILKNTKIEIISEEKKIAEFDKRKKWKYYWLVDPLDGTKEFIKKNGEFTVNIALIEGNNPILGVVYVPAKSLLYLAEKNKGSFKTNTKDKLENFEGIQKILVSSQTKRARVIGSRSHSNATFDNWVKEKFPNAEIVQAGSSLKFCLIAEGEADIYPRFGPTSEWDIAAGHMIVDEAGGKIRTFQDDSIKYNTKENIINPEFYAIGNIDLN